MCRLVIGNKTYSSWSLRVWFLMKALNIHFEEKVIPLDQPETEVETKKFSPMGLVPILIDGDFKVWDSLAIVEYLAEKHSEKSIWPGDVNARALARSISASIHSGLGTVGNLYPMNLGKQFAPRALESSVRRELDKVTSVICETRATFADDRPFLFGEFSAVDSFFAPLMARINTYSIEVDAVLQRYLDNILGHTAYLEWRDAAFKEKWVMDDCEIDAPVIKNFRQSKPGVVPI